MRWLVIAICGLAGTFFIAPAASSADIIFVKQDATGTNDGSSWENAFTELQDGLNDLDDELEQLWVAAGIYYADAGPLLIPRVFSSRDDRFVYGGFAGNEATASDRNPRANPTVLSGDIGIPAVASDNAETVLVVEPGSDYADVTVDGFVIEEASGVAFVAGNRSLDIANCEFRWNGNGAIRGASDAS